MKNTQLSKLDKITFMLNLYIFIFVFNMINREFVPFGLDIRYILVILAIPLIGNKMYLRIKGNRIKTDFIDRLVLLYALLFMFSNIAWMYNGLELGSDFISYNILFGFNILTIIIVILYKENVNIKLITKSILISGIVLFISMILVMFGNELSTIAGGGNYPGIVYGPEHINFLGMPFRLAGYAEDANYASIFMVIVAATSIYFIKNKILKYSILVMSILGVMLSGSKTVLIGIIIGLLSIYMINSKEWKINRFYNIFKHIFLISIIIGPYIAMKIISTNKIGLATMDNRFLMWNHAIELFEKYPLLGNGLTSFRSYFSHSIGGWYVQCHSTIFQIMSETGFVPLILFGLIFYYILKYKNSYTTFIAITFLVFSTTTELNHLSIMAFMLVIIPLIGQSYTEEKEIDKNKVLFLINSLGTGGAERVVANSANKMAENGIKVTVVTLKNQINYKFNENVKIISLNENENLGKIQKLMRIPINIIRINTIIAELEKETKFALVTSHLPITHIISRFLIIKDRIIFVIHNPHHHMDPNNSLIFKLLLRAQYNRCKVVSVSKGVEDELTIKYGVKCDKIKTIYNPIDIEKILKEQQEEFYVDYKYLLFCGRLTPQKRPDILIQAFYEGGFKDKYKLVLLGEGELKEELIKQCERLDLSDNVIFAGWQSNVYRWMKNCELMISTSDYEAFPMNLLEAFACSAKVVSMDCDFGPREILTDEYSKYLVPLNDMDKLVKTINEALDNYPNGMFDKIVRFDCENINKEYLNTSLEWVQ